MAQNTLPLPFDADTALAQMPCLECFSQNELWLVLLYVMSANTAYDVTQGHLDELQEAAKCLDTLSDKQMFQSVVAMLIDAFELDLTADDLRDKIKCLKCADPKTVREMILWLTYQWLNSRLIR